MHIKIPVAYASKYGSTQEVIEAIEATLRENDIVVDSKPIREEKDPEIIQGDLIGRSTLHPPLA